MGPVRQCDTYNLDTVVDSGRVEHAVECAKSCKDYLAACKNFIRACDDIEDRDALAAALPNYEMAIDGCPYKFMENGEGDDIYYGDEEAREELDLDDPKWKALADADCVVEDAAMKLNKFATTDDGETQLALMFKGVEDLPDIIKAYNKARADAPGDEHAQLDTVIAGAMDVYTQMVQISVWNQPRSVPDDCESAMKRSRGSALAALTAIDPSAAAEFN